MHEHKYTYITLANNKHACTYICSSQQLTSVMMKAIHVTLITVNGCVNNIRSGVRNIHGFTHDCSNCMHVPLAVNIVGSVGLSKTKYFMAS